MMRSSKPPREFVALKTCKVVRPATPSTACSNERTISTFAVATATYTATPRATPPTVRAVRGSSPAT